MKESALAQLPANEAAVHFPNSIHLADCYQCGKCTAGCPVASRMDIAPNQVVRLAQLGKWEKVLKSAAIWECIGCQTCSTRCPKSVDCAGVMDVLREASLRRGRVNAKSSQVAAFQKIFLENIRRHGRLNELDLIGRFKADVVRSGRVSFLFKDAELAPQLGKRRKLHLRSGKVGDRKVIERIFERCRSEREA